VLPFHHDDLLDDDAIALARDRAGSVVEPDLPDADRWQRLTALYDRFADRLATTLADAGSATVVNGDCLAMLATLTGAQRAGLDPGTVWFDAHGDVHTLASSTSGYLGGMALRMALGGDADRLVSPLGLRPLAEDRAVLVGVRDLDPPEADYLAGARVGRRSVDEVDAADLPEGPLVVHVDMDVLDPDALPDLRFPVPGGSSADAVLAAVRRLLDSGRVCVLDLACTWSDSTDRASRRVHRDLLARLLELP
jgi:arginase